jgi:hypothetical protein
MESLIFALLECEITARAKTHPDVHGLRENANKRKGT